MLNQKCIIFFLFKFINKWGATLASIQYNNVLLFIEGLFFFFFVAVCEEVILAMVVIDGLFVFDNINRVCFLTMQICGYHIIMITFFALDFWDWVLRIYFVSNVTQSIIISWKFKWAWRIGSKIFMKLFLFFFLAFTWENNCVNFENLILLLSICVMCVYQDLIN